MATTYVKGRPYKLKIADLLSDTNQARKFVDPISLNELTASIQKYGVLTPILFRRNEEGALVIVAGHRRVAAAARAGLVEISGAYTAGDTRLQGFVENLQREGLLPVEEAEEMAALMKEYTLNQYQLAEAIGKSQPTVSDSMLLNSLPEDILSACRTNPNIPKSILLGVAKMKSEKSMRRKFETYMKNAGKVNQPTNRKPRLTKERSLIVKTDDLSGELMDLPWRDWSEDDRGDLLNAMLGVRQTINNMLQDMNWTPEGEGQEETESPPSKNLS